MKQLISPHKRPVLLLHLLFVAALLISACSPGQVPQTGALPGLTLELTDTAVTTAGTAAPGVTTVSANNTGKAGRSVMLARLNTNVTLEQFTQTFATDDMAAVELVSLAGGRDAPAGETSKFTADLKEGTYVVIAFPDDGSDTPPATTSFQVSGSANGQADPQSSATVDMVDFAFEIPQDLTSGKHNLQVTNSGQQWHEILIVKPEPGFTQEKFLELFRASEPPQGQPPFEEIGSFGPLSAGERGWLEVDLASGTYFAICFLPDITTGESHVEKGMITSFEVK